MNQNNECSDAKFMSLALEYAKKGRELCSPNPAVGCIVVKDDKIVGTGWHERFGGAHAESMALDEAGNNAKGSTIYCTLEPCCHQGKTGACTELIIKAGVARVVFGTKDILHTGGASALRSEGLTVDRALQDECDFFLRWWLKYADTGKSYVLLKAGVTIDGKITESGYKRAAISSAASLKFIKNLRRYADCLLVGANTVRIDDPELSVPGRKEKPLVRVIVSDNCKLDKDYRIFRDQHAIVFCRQIDKELQTILRKRNILVVKIGKRPEDMPAIVLKTLAEQGLIRLCVEGGAEMYKAFLDADAVDEILLNIAPKVFPEGVPAFKDKRIFKEFALDDVWNIGDDVMVRYIKKKLTKGQVLK